MDGGKLTFQTKVKASTLLEVLIAMVVIMIVFGMAMMIYANVTRSSLSVKKIKAQAVLNDCLQNAEKSNDNTTQTITVDDLRIEQEVKTYHEDRNLLEIDLAAYDANQQQLTELHKVIRNTHE